MESQTHHPIPGEKATYSTIHPSVPTPQQDNIVTILALQPTSSKTPPTPSKPNLHITTPFQPPRPLLQTTSIIASLMATIFIVALDLTIIVTALPTISHDLNSEAAYTWVGTSYILAYTTSTPSWGRFSDIFGRKTILLGAIVLFFVGSLIDLFILRERGFYFGLISVVWAFASAAGPVVGGVFTQKASWRWCFWINLPITTLVFILLLFTLQLENPKTPFLSGLAAIDWIGSFLLISSTFTILLGLNLGGVTHPWTSPVVLSLIISGLVLFILFITYERTLTQYSIIPLHILTSSSAIASISVCFTHSLVYLGIAYYLPLYFQLVLGTSPLRSGVYLLPFLVGMTVFSALTGFLIMKTGRYMPAMYIGLDLTPLGIGLFLKFSITVDWAKLVVFQGLAAMGLGMNFEGPLLAFQAVVATKDVAMATATFGFVRSISSAVSVVVGGVVFRNQMLKQGPKLVASLGPELASQLVGGDAAANAGIINNLPVEQKVIARTALNQSVSTMWILYCSFAGLGLFAGMFMRAHHLSAEHEPVSLGLIHNDTQGAKGDAVENTT